MIQLRQTSISALMITGATVVASLGNFVFHGLVARAGGPGAYGSIGALLTLGTVSTFLVTGFQYAIARQVVVAGVRPSDWVRVGIHALWPALLVIPGLALAAPLVAVFLRLSGPGLVLLAVANVLFVSAAALPMGVLVGLGRFGTIAVLIALVMVLRVGSAFLLLQFVDPRTSALLASVIASAGLVLVSTLIAVGGEAAEAGTTQERIAPAGLAAEGAVSVAIVSMVWLTWLLPVAFARHNLSGVDSGRIAALQLVAGGLLFLTAPVATVFYPRIVANRDRATFAGGLLATALICFTAVAFMTIFGSTVARMVFGSNFVSGAVVSASTTVSASAVALVTYVLWSFRGMGIHTRVLFVLAIMAVVIEVILGTYAGTTPVLVTIGPAAGLGATTAVGLALWFIREHQTMRAIG